MLSRGFMCQFFELKLEKFSLNLRAVMLLFNIKGQCPAPTCTGIICMTFVDPLIPKTKIQIPFSFSLYMYVYYSSSKKKLLKYKENSSWVIISLSLITSLIDKVLILQGEI